MYRITNSEGVIISMSPPKYVKKVDPEDKYSYLVPADNEEEAEGLLAENTEDGSNQLYSIPGKEPLVIYSPVSPLSKEIEEAGDNLPDIAFEYTKWIAPYVGGIEVIPDGEYTLQNFKLGEKHTEDIDELQNTVVDEILINEESRSDIENALIEMVLETNDRLEFLEEFYQEFKERNPEPEIPVVDSIGESAEPIMED